VPHDVAQHRAADRSLRAHDGASRHRVGDRIPPQRLRAVLAPATGRTPLRRGRRCRSRPRRARAVPVRRLRDRLPPVAPGCRRPYGAVAEHVPVLRRHQRLRRGRPVLPGGPAAHRRGYVRGGCRPRNAAAQHLQLRLGRRLGRQPDDAHGRRAPVHRDGITSRARARSGGRGARCVHRRLQRDQQPRGGTYARGADDRYRSALLHPPPRLRGGGVRRADRRARRGHHAARRHVRHRGRGPYGRADHGWSAGRRTDRLR